MPDRRAIHLAPILLEASFVVLGVFLALVANEWRANANARDRGENARTGILEELRTNRAAVAAAAAYHEALFDSLGAQMGPDGKAPTPALFSEGFVKPATALTTAWDAAKATDAVNHMDYDDVLAFSRLYAMQERYATTAENTGSIIFGEIMARGVPGVAANYRNLIYLIGSFLHLERGLLHEYDTVLARFGGQAPPAVP